MMATGTVLRRQVGRETEALRATSRIPVTDSRIARIAGSTRTYQRFASGKRTNLTFPVIGALARLFGASIEKQAELERLWDLVDETSWLQSIDALTRSGFHAYIELERLACRIESNETLFVPGLLQSESYMRRLFERSGRYSPRRIDELVEQRCQRQTDFKRRGETVHLDVLMGEAVLRSACPRDQLESLLEADAQPNITVNYLPFSVGPQPGLELPYHVLSFTEDDDPDLAYFDAPDGARYIESAEAVAEFRNARALGSRQAKSIKELEL
ncbi:DUF5753 domain-containing protein [Glycomyces sp. TRM65418]|uniref:DUF5753 domain-containing protein n=1 Tax=Glycomyces sp. TRM65418 TaxID=2867006 RepID=UPI001CE6DCFD|nr:DUF5753 domain-containing protein [Glycomyces sp. TRM65418]MCC3762239.1 DUF5753 domain-containing protein [Glycomyces sp. TRM65418]QZD56298.1 DUF5753 domain-containing protein [Glycomyces sp. TRM65418]